MFYVEVPVFKHIFTNKDGETIEKKDTNPKKDDVVKVLEDEFEFDMSEYTEYSMVITDETKMVPMS